MYRHSTSAVEVAKTACFACAVEQSLSEAKDLVEMNSLFDDYLREHNLEIVSSEPDGYCLVNSWMQALFLQGQDWSLSELLHEAVNEMMSYPAIYGLTSSSAVELKNYVRNGNFMSNAIDSLPKALVNITRFSCVLHIMHVDKSISTLVFKPDFGDDIGTIQVAYHAYRLHYDTLVEKTSKFFVEFQIHKNINSAYLLLEA
jgi:hypothetical protein